MAWRLLVFFQGNREVKVNAEIFSQSRRGSKSCLTNNEYERTAIVFAGSADMFSRTLRRDKCRIL
jgi:hypothetical protein